jgi:hypothetical protein
MQILSNLKKTDTAKSIIICIQSFQNFVFKNIYIYINIYIKNIPAFTLPNKVSKKLTIHSDCQLFQSVDLIFLSDHLYLILKSIISVRKIKCFGIETLCASLFLYNIS